MTNEQLGGIAVRFLLIPLFFGVAFLGGYFVYKNLESYRVKTELESYFPVRASNYSAFQDAGGNVVVTYEFNVGGVTYSSEQISPFARINEQVNRSDAARRKLQRYTEWLPVVYYDPADPTKASLLRTVPHKRVLNAVGIGGAIFTGGLLLLYLATRRVRRVEELLKKRPTVRAANLNPGAAAGAVSSVGSEERNDDRSLPEEDRMVLDDALTKEAIKAGRADFDGRV